jgi:hypothetical protein
VFDSPPRHQGKNPGSSGLTQFHGVQTKARQKRAFSFCGDFAQLLWNCSSQPGFVLIAEFS